jgi:hypothetical protein
MRTDWCAHAAREEERYREGVQRLPDEPDPRQKQLVRLAMAAGGAGLARLMQGREDEASGWFVRSAERYRESFEHAPPESWGRLIGAVKARILARDWGGAERDAEWALAQNADASNSPISRYAGALATLVLGRDAEAASISSALRAGDETAFPRSVADSLLALAGADADAYAREARAVLRSFETREAYLEDVPVADTVIVLEALAERRGIAAGLHSSLLPP